MEKEHGKKSHYLKEQERLMDAIRELGSLPSTAYTMFRETGSGDLMKRLSQAHSRRRIGPRMQAACMRALQLHALTLFWRHVVWSAYLVVCADGVWSFCGLGRGRRMPAMSLRDWRCASQVKTKLRTYSDVNKKAIDQYINFTEQREQLLLRKDELDKGAEAIRELIDVLDYRKCARISCSSMPTKARPSPVYQLPTATGCRPPIRISEWVWQGTRTLCIAERHRYEAIERTFKGVAKFFSDVFAELVPGTGCASSTR
jgi:hypothetical protein